MRKLYNELRLTKTSWHSGDKGHVSNEVYTLKLNTPPTFCTKIIETVVFQA